MNRRIRFHHPIAEAEKAHRFSGILVLSACCLCCIHGTGGSDFCT